MPPDDNQRSSQEISDHLARLRRALQRPTTGDPQKAKLRGAIRSLEQTYRARKAEEDAEAAEIQIAEQRKTEAREDRNAAAAETSARAALHANIISGLSLLVTAGALAVAWLALKEEESESQAVNPSSIPTPSPIPATPVHQPRPDR